MVFKAGWKGEVKWEETKSFEGPSVRKSPRGRVGESPATRAVLSLDAKPTLLLGLSGRDRGLLR